VDKLVLKEVKTQRCIACNNPETDPAHIKSRGSGGGDTHDNLLPLCRRCHTEQHSLGWRVFAGRYAFVTEALAQRGWKINDRGRIERV
jgi:hypothetical protein